MRIRNALVAVSVLAVAGCGDLFGGPTLESGTYAVSDATLASTSDQCGLLGAYTDPDKKIGVTVNEDTVTFNLSNDAAAAPASLPTATMSEGMLTQLAEANYTIAFGTTCVVRVHRSVTGDIVENNKASVTLAFSVAEESGDCVPSETAFSAIPCSSSYNFTITKE
jgi:hypothetical protein